MKKRYASGTSVLVSTSADSLDSEIMIVDVNSERTRVVITTSNHRQEGSPESALDFAKQIRQRHGEAADTFAEAIERAANFCLTMSKTPRPILQ